MPRKIPAWPAPSAPLLPGLPWMGGRVSLGEPKLSFDSRSWRPGVAQLWASNVPPPSPRPAPPLPSAGDSSPVTKSPGSFRLGSESSVGVGSVWRRSGGSASFFPVGSSGRPPVLPVPPVPPAAGAVVPEADAVRLATAEPRADPAPLVCVGRPVGRAWGTLLVPSLSKPTVVELDPHSEVML